MMSVDHRYKSVSVSSQHKTFIKTGIPLYTLEKCLIIFAQIMYVKLDFKVRPFFQVCNVIPVLTKVLCYLLTATDLYL